MCLTQVCFGTADESSSDRVQSLHHDSNLTGVCHKTIELCTRNIADCTSVSAALTCCRAPGGCRLREVVHGPMKWVLASNYMLDMTWLLSACPHLISAGQLVIVHGERTPDRSLPPFPPPSSPHFFLAYPWSTIQTFFDILGGIAIMALVTNMFTLLFRVWQVLLRNSDFATHARVSAISAHCTKLYHM